MLLHICKLRLNLLKTLLSRSSHTTTLPRLAQMPCMTILLLFESNTITVSPQPRIVRCSQHRVRMVSLPFGKFPPSMLILRHSVCHRDIKMEIRYLIPYVHVMTEKLFRGFSLVALRSNECIQLIRNLLMWICRFMYIH